MCTFNEYIKKKNSAEVILPKGNARNFVIAKELYRETTTTTSATPHTKSRINGEYWSFKFFFFLFWDDFKFFVLYFFSLCTVFVWGEFADMQTNERVHPQMNREKKKNNNSNNHLPNRKKYCDDVEKKRKKNYKKSNT